MKIYQLFALIAVVAAFLAGGSNSAEAFFFFFSVSMLLTVAFSLCAFYDSEGHVRVSHWHVRHRRMLILAKGLVDDGSMDSATFQKLALAQDWNEAKPIVYEFLSTFVSEKDA